MKGLIKSYADWLLKIYSSFSSVPKEMDELNKAQKVWLILACPCHFFGWLSAFIVLIILLDEGTFEQSGVEIIVIFIFGGFFLPLIAYWVIEGIYTLVSWVKK